MWVFDADTSRIVRRSVSYVPGLYKIFDEIIVNAADNKQRDPTMTMLKVTVDKAAGSISVWNNGRGIPIARHAEHGCYIPELIFGHLLTGSNFNDQEKKTTGGRNGYGAKLANIFSTEFVVETADGATRKRYRQVFRNNMGDKDEPVIKDYDGDEFTCITFKPDWRRFGMAGMEDDTEALLQKRAHDIAGCMSSYGGKRVRVYLNKQQLDVKSFKDYLGLYEGLSDLVLHERIGTWDIAIGPSDGQLQQVSFVNAICTVKGGQHVTHIAEQIVAHLVKVVKRKSKGTEVKPVHVRNHLCVCVNALVENPAFDSQSKETLTTKASAFGGADLKLSDKALKAIEKSPIVEAILAYTNFQASKALDKKSGKKTSKLTGITKLDDANFAGTKHSQDCTLILTEGDSAKTLAVSGLGVVGRDYYGVFPLKGKPLNVRETAHAAVSKNEEISNIVKILGLKFGTQYADARALRYGHLMIMTDQDHDGSHIKGLLINLLHYFWPSLLRVEGFLLEFITPIVKCVRAGRELSFFTVPEYETWRAAHAQQRGWSIKYYKGLGTSTAKEAKEYFAKLDQHQIPFEWRDDAADGDMVDLVFNKKRAEDRKEWLRNFVPGTFVDYGVDAMTYDAFFNRELILFSIEDNKRSLPCMVDGLKPSQRKVLFACFKRKLKNEIKVAQLAGYVSEHSAYHHGEVSLTGTITAMAQSYCGSNNVALLYPGGQFGTRLMGGKDQASPRYIFTRLDKVARAIFHPDDDAILTYLDDDGMSIEPAYYVPVLPLVLVNGAEGIGTGWSSGVPNYSPRDVMENLRRRIRGQPMVEMQPWYRGFVGTIARKAGGAKGSSFTVEGIVERTGDETLEITELPVKKWTQDYKAFLESPTKAAAKPRFHIKDFRENHTDTTVHFTITMDKSDLDAIEQQPGGLSKFFKLETTLAETNMTLFDNTGMIARYESPLQIMEEFYDLRLRHYGMRKEHLLARMQKEWMRLDNKVRFVVAVVQGKLEVRNRKKSELLAQLRADGFDPLLPESAAKSVGSKAKAEDEGDEDAAAASDDDSDSESAALAKGYDYLLGLKLWTLTKEVVAKLLAELAAKKQEMEELRAMELSDLWLRDLDAVGEVCVERCCRLA
ncbi:topoisomerase [Tribonema minus]|uniref:DNA topoisomerase 2 n=1 Tax=Tribonema minus TaxID=303371 RepID=A0A835YRC0_9STRA|nr:topoisomerase [Tribonema minus]